MLKYFLARSGALAILKVSGIKKHFGGNDVLQGIDLEINAGRIYQLIGSNGCGKTTLINVISGMYPPDEGTVTFEGADITRLGLYETYRLGLARTWQIPQPFSTLNTGENFFTAGTPNAGESFLVAPLKHRWRGDERAVIERAKGMMAMTSLSEKREVESQDLSGGQQKLLEMGRVMMSGAKMILMDEPIAGVNPTLAHSIFEKITSICKEQGVTFLIVEHRLDIALQYVERVFAMDGGHIIASGTPDEVTSDPRVVESYLGG